ncbi:MAG: rhomboid family intramembrane serine protease [Myxococcota bacterium]|nr:rhomboid family intramembrane serine protease [Myxococcota bacterium]
MLQWQDPFVSEVGVMVPSLVDSGQVYRLISANFLHGLSLIPVHLLFNAIGLIGLALLVERPLGSIRTAVVMGASGLMAMLSSHAIGGATVLGASGIVMGLAGSALCLELHRADRLPVWWRVPRRPFVALLVLEAVMGFALPFVAGEAHLGGLMAGYLTTRVVMGEGAFTTPPSRWQRRTAIAMAVVTVAALLNVSFLLLRESNALERYGKQLLATDDITVDHDNGTAWRMATESRATVEQLETAQRLAERAADRTDYGNPEILDTLAEVLFVRGDREGALRTIDEAIRLTRGESYYVEQRRRFTGERDFDDRPAPPTPWRERAPREEDWLIEPGVVI